MSTRGRRWPIAGVLLFLVGLRFRVLLDVISDRSLGELTAQPLLLLGAWQDLMRSVCGEALVLLVAVALLGLGSLGRWLARGVVAALLVVNVSQLVVFGYWGAYLNGYQLIGRTAGELSSAVTANVGGLNGLLLVLSFVLAWFFGGIAPVEWGKSGWRQRVLAGTLVVLFAVAAFQLERWPLAYRVTAHSPALAAVRVRPPELSWLPEGRPAKEDWAIPTRLEPRWSHLADAQRPLNVVVLLLESIRARSFWPHPDAPPMPNLARHAEGSAVFTRAYAHSPQSIRGLEALMFGTFPPPAWQVALQRRNDIAIDSLPRRLSSNGIRSAVLLNGDDRFDEQGPLIASRGLTLFAAADAITGPHPPKSDLNLVPMLERFIDAAPEEPFVAVMMTRETHFPYIPVSPSPDDPPAGSQAAYLREIEKSDVLIAQTLQVLEARGLAENTVVVLTADHGESFREHLDGGSGHGQRVYDESLHVPLVFINPKLFRGERDERIVQLNDVGATVAWLAGSPSPALNVGASVFFERPSHAAYLVNFPDGLAGAVVHGRFKYHYIRAPGEPIAERLYDVLADPGETLDLSAREPDALDELRERYFGWFNFWLRRWSEATSGDQHDPARLSEILFEP